MDRVGLAKPNHSNDARCNPHCLVGPTRLVTLAQAPPPTAKPRCKDGINPGRGRLGQRRNLRRRPNGRRLGTWKFPYKLPMDASPPQWRAVPVHCCSHITPGDSGLLHRSLPISPVLSPLATLRSLPSEGSLGARTFFIDGPLHASPLTSRSFPSSTYRQGLPPAYPRRSENLFLPGAVACCTVHYLRGAESGCCRDSDQRFVSP